MARAPAVADPPCSANVNLAVGRGPSGYLAGMILGEKYRLREQVGEGGMGAIWTADHLALCVEVAVKIIHPELSGTAASDRLLLEAHAAALLRHRSIVKVYDFGFSEFGDPYFVMERLHGGSLLDMLQREGALPQEYAVQLMLPIVEAIVAAHAQGIVHRDIKPENIMIGTDDVGCIVPKVLDFGVAKLTSSPMGKPPITLGDSIVGTPEYMSPEQARGEPDVDERADVWGLSMILYEMLAGRRPFSGSNHFSVLISIIETPMPPLYAIDSGLASIVSRGLSKDRAERWGSAREFGVALAEWLIRRGIFEDITTASVRARWNLNSWRPPSDRPVSELPPALAIPLWSEAPLDQGNLVPRNLASRILDRLAPSKGHVAAVLGSFLLLAILAMVARGVSNASVPSTAAPSTPASTVAVFEATEPRQAPRMDRLPSAAPPADSAVDVPPTVPAGSLNPLSTGIRTSPRAAAERTPSIATNDAQFVGTIRRPTRTPTSKAESDEQRRGSGKVDFGF